MKSFIQIIRQGDRGQLLQDCERALEEIITAINSYGGTGSITVKAKIKGKGDAFIVSTELKSEVPAPPRTDAMFFYDTEQGELTRKDPRQPDLPVVVEADFKNGVTNKAAGGE